MKTWKQLWDMLKGNRLFYLGAIACVLLGAVISTMPTLVLSMTLDSVIGGEPLKATGWLQWLVDALGGTAVLRQNLWVCGLLMVSLTGLESVCGFGRGVLTSLASENIAQTLRDKLYHHLQVLPYSYHANATTGDLIQRCTSDVETVRRFFAGQVVEMVRSLAMVVVTLYVMISLNGTMTLISLIVIPFIFLFTSVFFGKVVQRFRAFDEAEGEMSAALQENLTGVRVVKAFARQDYEIKRFEERNRSTRDLGRRMTMLNARFWTIGDLLSTLAVVLVVVFGSVLSVRGTITLGVFVAFVSYIQSLIWPIHGLGRIMADMGRMQVSLSRIYEILNAEPEPEVDGTLKPNIRGEIEFDDVTFAYGGSLGVPVLKNMSFHIRPGETVAILGATGSGKSTVAHLIQRLFPLKKGSGTIRIDGLDIRDIERTWLRHNVGLILQEPFLFSKNVRENIRLGRSGATDEEVFAAARVAHIHDGINDFERGYDTLVGEKGVTLSGGQKQRVVIARTLLMDPPIMIFDDSLSAVDAETDAQIRADLRKRRDGGATTIIISHRLSTLREADRILVIEAGRIAQEGTHATLVHEPGLYRRVWDIQSTLEEELGRESTDDTAPEGGIA